MTMRERMVRDMKAGKLKPVNMTTAISMLKSEEKTVPLAPAAENSICMGIIAIEKYYGSAKKIYLSKSEKVNMETHCSVCNAKINQNSKFCPYCGTRFLE